MWYKLHKAYIGTNEVRPRAKNFFNQSSFEEYQALVDSVGSVQFVDSWYSFRFNFCCYIGNKTILDFANNSNIMRTIDVSDLSNITYTSTTLNFTMPDAWLRIWYLWDNRVLTNYWILDFNGNLITELPYKRSVTVWDTNEIWAKDSSGSIYKGTLSWDNITWSNAIYWWSDQWIWHVYYGNLWAYSITDNDTLWDWISTYIDPVTLTTSNIVDNVDSRMSQAASWADGKLYRNRVRYEWWCTLTKIWTTNEWAVWTATDTNWYAWWNRFGKFLWNIVAWWMNSENWIWWWWWSNSYFIATDWTLTLSQANALWYDTNIQTHLWCIDEDGYIYPFTSWWWSWVILKTDKTFGNLNWKNPYLWR